MSHVNFLGIEFFILLLQLPESLGLKWCTIRPDSDLLRTLALLDSDYPHDRTQTKQSLSPNLFILRLWLECGQISGRGHNSSRVPFGIFITFIIFCVFWIISFVHFTSYFWSILFNWVHTMHSILLYMDNLFNWTLNVHQKLEVASSF